MHEAIEVQKNTVSAKGQLPKSSLLHIFCVQEASIRILFVGNSITYHAPKPAIGWSGSWGMAASCKDNDYVHQTVKRLSERYGAVSYGIAQVASWETSCDESEEAWKEPYLKVSDFKPDVVVIRLGENISSGKLETLDVRPYIENMIEFFGTGSQQIIVTDCFWRRDKLDQIFKQICDDKGYTFCQLSDLYSNPKTMALNEFEHQGVSLHPSDYGMALIAERIEKCIKWGRKIHE